MAIVVVAFFVGATISAPAMPPEPPVAEPVVSDHRRRAGAQLTPSVEALTAAGAAPDGAEASRSGPAVPTQVGRRRT